MSKTTAERLDRWNEDLAELKRRVDAIVSLSASRSSVQDIQYPSEATEDTD
jgi:hypothetical protein